jgi:hypothetical protein
VSAHAALPSGFTILNFGNLGEPDVAHVEHILGALGLDKVGDVPRARLISSACCPTRSTRPSAFRPMAMSPCATPRTAPARPTATPPAAWTAFLVAVRAREFDH